MRDEHGIRAVLAAAPLVSYQGTLTRFVFEEFRRTASSPIGAERKSGRYNSRGIPALYTSFYRQTAFSEFTNPFEESHPVGVASMLSLVANLQRVLDLTDGKLLTTLGTSVGELSAPRHFAITSPSQLVGNTVHALGYDGIIVWSAVRATEKNLIVFPTNSSIQTPLLVVTKARSPAR